MLIKHKKCNLKILNNKVKNPRNLAKFQYSIVKLIKKIVICDIVYRLIITYINWFNL